LRVLLVYDIHAVNYDISRVLDLRHVAILALFKSIMP
jgi:hypothetical protein